MNPVLLAALIVVGIIGTAYIVWTWCIDWTVYETTKRILDEANDVEHDAEVLELRRHEESM